MKLLSFLSLVALILGCATAAPAAWQDDYSALLQKYVTPTGVSYREWHANQADVQKMVGVTDAIAAARPPGGKDERLAFYINAYNAWILRNILHDYPTKGPGGGGFFGRKRFFGGDHITVGGKKMSFNDLEHEVIRAEFADPGVHFALNCASRSCPPLMDRAFTGANLQADFRRLADAYINQNPEGVREKGGDYQVSSIFKWYKDDFESDAGSVRAYINKYRRSPIPGDAEIRYLDYNWNLNEARR
ncbi:DUF547 domain-containing protein [soil metagenome]